MAQPESTCTHTHAITTTIESNNKQNKATAKRNPYRLDVNIKGATFSEADWPPGLKLYQETNEQAWS